MNQEKIGNFIKTIRKKNNLTQKELADLLGVTFQAVSKWENGKNIPDISVLKEISKKFNVNIDEILEGETKSKKNNKILYIIISTIIISIILLIIVISNINKDHDFEFKQISTSCSNFNITGSLAYNKDKASFYISKVEFCGTDDNKTYKDISCTLYEKHETEEKIVSTCNTNKDVTLEEYLKEVEISVDNYTLSCGNLSNSHLYLEINATEEDNKSVTYNIPITLIDNCKK